MKLKILFAVHGYKPAYRIGGPIHSVSAVAETLVQRGHSVTVFTSNSNLTEDLDVATDTPIDVNGVEVWYFKRDEPLQRWFPRLSYLSKSMGFLYLPRMRAELDRLVPSVDVVHTHLPYIYPTYAAAKAAFRFDKPLFYHQRGVFDPERLKFRGMKKLAYIRAVERPIMRRATTLIALTRAEEASYRALGVSTPCAIIPNGIDPQKHRTAPRPGFDKRSGIPATAPVILFLSRIHPTKGADRLLDAFIRIAGRVPDARLVMAGPDEWELMAGYRQTAADAGLTDRVIFPGMLTGEDKLDFLARADVFALPSDAEGFSMAVLEAMVSATPVLLSPGCHFDEVEEAGVGRVVPNDPSPIAAALEDMLSDRAALKAAGSRAREFVSKNYSWERICDRLTEVYVAGVRTRASASARAS